MGSFLTGIGNGLGTLVGGAGNAGAASSNAWNYGQYSPFTVNNPAGSIGFNGTTATGSLSPLQQQIQTQLGSNVTGANTSYNPNTSFLPQQYQNIFNQGNFNAGVQNQFQNSVNGVMPFMQQANASNLDNQFSKGTLASTAGGYQTAGFNQGLGATLSGLQNQAFQNQLGLSNSQFGAANSTAGLGEQQAQFAPQLGMGLMNSSLSGLNNQNNFMNQMMMTGGNLGAQRSGANVNAATPGIETGNIQDNATAGLLSGLLFGGGSQGGLLQSLLGSSGSGGGGLIGGLGSIGSGAGNLLKGLFGGNSNGSSQSDTPGFGYGTPYNPDNSSFTGDPGGTSVDWNGATSQNDGWSQGTPDWFAGTNFNAAGGEAANQNLQNIGVDNVELNPSASQSINSANSAGNTAGSYLGGLADVGGLLSGIAKGGVSGGAGAALSAGKLYNDVIGHNGAFGGALGNIGGALSVYNGLSSGTPAGYTQAALSGTQLAASSGALTAMGASPATSAAIGSAAGALGLFAMPVIMGMTSNATDPNANYIKNMQAGISAPKGSTENTNANMELVGLLGGDKKFFGELPPSIQQYAFANRLDQTVQNLGTYKGPIGPSTNGVSRNQN